MCGLVGQSDAFQNSQRIEIDHRSNYYKDFRFQPEQIRKLAKLVNRNKHGAPIDKLLTLLKHWGKLKLEGMSNRGGLEIGLTCNRKTTWRLNIKTAGGEWILLKYLFRQSTINMAMVSLGKLSSIKFHFWKTRKGWIFQSDFAKKRFCFCQWCVDLHV